MSNADENNENFVFMSGPWGGGSFDCQLQLVNIQDGSMSKNKTTPIYEAYKAVGEQINSYPTAGFISGDKFFVSFYTMDASSWETFNADTAFVSVYSYPELEYIKTIKDTRTGPIGYYWGGQGAIIENERGDHFTVTNGSKVGGFDGPVAKEVRNSGILKINAGEDEFDENYFFDVEAEGYKVFNAQYVGDGLAVARVMTLANDDLAATTSGWGTWGILDAETALINTVILDLNNKTVKIVNEVPLQVGDYMPMYYKEGDKVYMSVSTGRDAYIYQVDAKTATAKRGAKIIGKRLQGIFGTSK